MEVENKKDNLLITKKKDQKKLLFIWKNIQYTFIPLAIGLIAGVISFFLTFDSYKSDKREIIPIIKEEMSSKDLQNRYDFEKLLRDIERIGRFDSLEIAKDIAILKSDYSRLSSNLNSLNSLLQDDPTKFLEIAMIKKDIDDIKKQVENNNKNIQRDVDRISSYNNTLIVFMITFLVAYIGIGIFNLIDKAKKNSNI